MVGRLDVEHAGALTRFQNGARNSGSGRLPELLVRGDVKVGPAEPAVAQQPVDVGVPRDHPLAGRLVEERGRLAAQLGERRVGVGDELRATRGRTWSGRPSVGSDVAGARPVRAARGGLHDRARLAEVAVLRGDLYGAGRRVDVHGAEAQQPLERPGA